MRYILQIRKDREISQAVQFFWFVFVFFLPCTACRISVPPTTDPTGVLTTGQPERSIFSFILKLFWIILKYSVFKTLKEVYFRVLVWWWGHKEALAPFFDILRSGTDQMLCRQMEWGFFVGFCGQRRACVQARLKEKLESDKWRGVWNSWGA